MEADLDTKIIKATQTTLGKYIKRPPLSDKLLKKPPFRFLHDIVTSVLKSTGFFKGLFDESELISENVKDREAKISFLNKIIFVVGKTTGEKLLVKPSKIVAGQEPEKTNELLQCLALALDRKLTSDEAVKQFKREKGDSVGDKITKEPVAANVEIDSKKSYTKSNDRSSKNDKSQGQTIKSKLKENVKVKKETLPKNISQQNKVKSKEKSDKTINEIKENIARDQHSNYNDTRNNDSSAIILEESTRITNVIQQKNEDLNSASAIINQSFNSDSQTSVQTSGISQVPSSESNEFVKLVTSNVSENHTMIVTILAEETKTLGKFELNNIDTHDESGKVDMNTNNELQSEDSCRQTQKSSENSDAQIVETSNLRQSTARPTSSRPGAPRVRERHENNIATNNITVIGKVHIISENSLLEEDEESSIVIENKTNLDTSEQPENLLVNQHGHLVQQILDSQKEFSHVSGKTEIEWQLEAQKARNDINKDIENLRFNIQALSRIANPLGKLLDHMQEDVEVMRQESLQWIQTYEETFKELIKQKALNEEVLLPLHSKIKLLEAEIMEKHEKIDDLKIIIYKNNKRIDRLLTNGGVQ